MPLTPTSTNNGIVLTEVVTAIAERCVVRTNSVGKKHLPENLSVVWSISHSPNPRTFAENLDLAKNRQIFRKSAI
jgi:hypothetical protein